MSWRLPSESLTTSMCSSCCKYVQYILRITKQPHFGIYLILEIIPPYTLIPQNSHLVQAHVKHKTEALESCYQSQAVPCPFASGQRQLRLGYVWCILPSGRCGLGPKCRDASGSLWMCLDVSAALCGMLHSMVAALLRALESTASAEILAWKCGSISLRIRTPGLLVSWIYHSDIWPHPWLCSWRCTSRCSHSRWLGWEFLPRITTGNTK